MGRQLVSSRVGRKFRGGNWSQAMSESYESAATELMTTGGDARICLDPVTGLNRYHSAPRPTEVLAYASSTANDISAPAFAHVVAALEGAGGSLDASGYAERL